MSVLFGLVGRRAPWCVLGLLLTVGGSISGCSGGNVQFRAVRVVDYYDQRELLDPFIAGLERLIGREAAENSPLRRREERPHLLQLRIEFSSTADLWDVAQSGANVSLEIFFCSRPNDDALIGGPEVYSGGEEILMDERPHGQSAINRERTYYFYADVARKEYSGSPRIGFDFRSGPEDVCFRVREGWTLWVRKSDVAHLPRSDIESALREARDLVDSTPVDTTPAQ
jgi:hypothetical protein